MAKFREITTYRKEDCKCEKPKPKPGVYPWPGCGCKKCEHARFMGALGSVVGVLVALAVMFGFIMVLTGNHR